MKLYKTKHLEIASQLPTDLDIKRILLARSPNPTVEDEKEVSRLKAGEVGEQKVVELFQKYGLTHWVGLQNIWLENYGTFEIDLTVTTNHCQYVIEIKNYKGDYKYKDGVSTVGDFIIPKNPIDQARQAVSNMKNIMKEYPQHLPVKGVLIFTGEKSHVSIQSPVDDILIMKLDDLYAFIQKMILEEQGHAYHSTNIQSVLDHIETFEVACPYPPKPITKNQLKKIRRGISCAYCGNYELKFQKSYVKCKCGLEEPREEAVIRTICEYGALHFENHLFTRKLLDFLDDQVSYTYLQRLLVKHFEMMKNQRYTYYVNKRLLYAHIYLQFKIDLPIYYYSKRGRPIIHILE